MREIETKILNIYPEEIIPKIEKYVKERCGELVATFDGEIEAIYFKSHDNSNDSIVRLRKKTNTISVTPLETIELTIKKPRESFYPHFKTCDEENIYVDSLEQGLNVLRLLGYKKDRTITKHRMEYLYNTMFFEFDTINGYPTWLEIEAPLESDITKVIEYLGYTMDDACNKSQLELHDSYFNRNDAQWTLEKREKDE